MVTLPSALISVITWLSLKSGLLANTSASEGFGLPAGPTVIGVSPTPETVKENSTCETSEADDGTLPSPSGENVSVPPAARLGVVLSVGLTIRAGVTPTYVDPAPGAFEVCDSV